MTNIKQVEFTKPAINDGVVKTLEEWLQRARDGQIQAVAIAGVRPGGATSTEWRGVENDGVHQLNSAIAILHFRFLRMNVGPEE